MDHVSRCRGLGLSPGLNPGPGEGGGPPGPPRAVLIDIGGVLVPDYLPAAAAEWGARLGISQESFLAAVFGGSDGQVLIGRVSESSWWDTVGGRLSLTAGELAGLRRDLAAREVWDGELVTLLRRLRGRARTAIVSNSWPQLRARMAAAGLLDIVDEIVLSAEAGWAKPDARIYAAALRRLSAAPGDALFVDDTPGHVAAAEALGLAGHVHRNTAGTIARIDDWVRQQG
jgi:putative hydrolase of the HAD superfamily